ncbi:MAG: Ig-like domain-containing protein [Actinomycetota bacterium]
MSRRAALVTASAVIASFVQLVPSQEASATSTEVNRTVEAVVMTGQQFPTWSRLPAEGVADPNPLGSLAGRDAHAGTLQVPQDPRAGVPVNQMTGFRWKGNGWRQIPIQVDQRFPYFLANQNSSFQIYSWTDEELTYQWDQETWKKIAGECTAMYPDSAHDPSKMKGYPTLDPVQGFDDDDELSFYVSDAGPQAPTDAPAPPRTVLTDAAQPGFQPRQEVRLVDPLTGTSSFVYLFLRTKPPAFDASNGYVHYERDANADEWVDRYSFADGGAENLSSSNGNYGPNLRGTVCRTATNPADPNRQTPDGVARSSTDRFPRDGMTVSTRSYQLHASGRWMVRSTRVAEPGKPGHYGVDLIDRWKGRAFQQNPDSNISVVGFEDEQVNWEANGGLLGERTGPVRAIREVWGADSGTNTTKVEYYYRDYYVFRYHLRVHPVPPDGLYTDWDNNAGAVTTYYDEGLNNLGMTAGVAIDGKDDEKVGNIDSNPVTGNSYFDIVDPTFSEPLSFFNWEEVSGPNGSLVYMFQLNDARDAEEPLIIPYYRDDACFDDGTGDDPVARPWPGEASSDARVKAGYSAENNDTPYADLKCDQKQGAWAQHGIHYLFTSDTDNAWQVGKPTTEVDGQQYVWAAPTDKATNLGDRYANTVKAAVVPSVTPQPVSSVQHETAVTNTGSVSGTAGSTVTLAAHLVDDTGKTLAGRAVVFALEGQDAQSATTDANGDATVQIALSGPARQAQLVESFDGELQNEESADSVTFVVATS